MAELCHEAHEALGRVRVQVVEDEHPLLVGVRGNGCRDMQEEICLGARGGDARQRDGAEGNEEGNGKVEDAVPLVLVPAPHHATGDGGEGRRDEFGGLDAGLLVGTCNDGALLVKRGGFTVCRAQVVDRGNNRGVLPVHLPRVLLYLL